MEHIRGYLGDRVQMLNCDYCKLLLQVSEVLCRGICNLFLVFGGEL